MTGNNPNHDLPRTGGSPLGRRGAGSGKGGIFRRHGNTVTRDTIIEEDENAVAAGPLTVAPGVTLTVRGNLTIV
jgi:hypothetical protein